jgi:hypothetical protein
MFACGDDGNGQGADATPTQQATQPAPEPIGATATPAPEPTEGAPFEGAQDPVEGTVGGGGDSVATLRDVRTGQHEGFDRIVFEFEGGSPGYRVEYVDGAVGCGSGEPVDLEGSAFLQVRFTLAQAHDEAGKATIDATELAPGFVTILEAVQTCDFEADVTWVLGLSQRLDFRVTPLTDPLRLAVDIGHP